MGDAVDVLIIGAGPAGLCAALRLRQLGYRVMLVERSTTWPRKQIGEALTPGVQNIIGLLGANDALDGVPHLARQPTQLLWRTRAAEMLADGGSAIVNRAQFDAALLALARVRGVEVEMPAQVHALGGEGGDWRVALRTGEGALKQVAARWIVDAGGRAGHSHQPRLDCAPRLAALWADIPQAALPAHLLAATHTEAFEHGWLWGARLPGRRYRIMLVCDPLTAHTAMPGTPSARLGAACSGSALFSALATCDFGGAIGMCSATPYIAPASWQHGRLKIGDAAFALDPISSSGVEKAMRFALQAAVAIHTQFSGASVADASLARDFFEARLIEAGARHMHWTAETYRQAWCAELPWWRQRACPCLGDTDQAGWGDFQARLRDACAQVGAFQAPDPRPLTAFDPRLALRLSAQVSLVELPCVIADRVQSQLALDHPNLERPLAFLENEALLPRLQPLRQAQALSHVLDGLSTSMPAHKAQRIVAWLWQHGLLDSVNA